MPRTGPAWVARVGVRRSCEHAGVTWTLQTERLDLRPLEPGDVDALYVVVGDPISMRFYPQPFNRARTTVWIEWALARYERDGFGLLAVVERATGELIGDCGPMVQPVNGSDHVELGWHIRRDRHGLGYATEAGAACRDEAWRVIVPDRLISIIRPENVPSWSVARKLGFRPWTTEVRAGMGHIIWSVEPPA
jgi:[ribosomal protein S5]-alanine N-acetyltransferase